MERMQKCIYNELCERGQQFGKMFHLKMKMDCIPARMQIKRGGAGTTSRAKRECVCNLNARATCGQTAPRARENKNVIAIIASKLPVPSDISK